MILKIRLIVMGALLMSLGSSLHGQELAITWDDLPAHGSMPAGETRAEIVMKVIAAMKSEHMPPVYGFINGSQTAWVGDSDAIFRAWIESGNLLGNHTWSHLNLDDHTAAEFEGDLEKNEPLLAKWMGSRDWRWLRYPFLAEGKTPEQRNEIRAYLAKRNYRVAAVTMSFPDYDWDEPYARCVDKRDAAGVQQLETNYLQAAREAAAYSRKMAISLYGRDIPYVLLLHIGPLDTEMLPRLLAQYRAMGFSFTTLEKAQSDPFYQADMHPTSKDIAPLLESRMAQRGLPLLAPPSFTKFDSLCR